MLRFRVAGSCSSVPQLDSSAIALATAEAAATVKLRQLLAAGVSQNRGIGNQSVIISAIGYSRRAGYRLFASVA
jgi:hypothetical protein